jgi:antitoxin component of RelBE/YafQ-DinJ toxin-antitoxin module
MFYSQVILNQGLPFDVKIPNTDTLKALKEAEESIHLVRSKSAAEMFKKHTDSN